MRGNTDIIAWTGIELVGVVAFTVFPLLHILDRSRKAPLFLIPGLLYLIFFVTCMVSREAGRLWPISRVEPVWSESSLEWAHLLLFISFVFFAVSPVLRWRAALGWRPTEDAFAGDDETPT